MRIWDGAEVLRQLRLLDRQVRVVLSSGFNEAEAIRRFMQKPYTASQLAERVKHVLSEPTDGPG
jgi:CheY-like chemotaxis protein